MGLSASPLGLKVWSRLWVYKCLFTSELNAISGGGWWGEAALSRESCWPQQAGQLFQKGQGSGQIWTLMVSSPWCYFHGYATFDGKRDLADVIKVASLLILREGDYVGLSGCAQWSHMSPEAEEAAENVRHRKALVLAWRWKEPHAITLFSSNWHSWKHFSYVQLLISESVSRTPS